MTRRNTGVPCHAAASTRIGVASPEYVPLQAARASNGAGGACCGGIARSEATSTPVASSSGRQSSGRGFTGAPGAARRNASRPAGRRTSPCFPARWPSAASTRDSFRRNSVLEVIDEQRRPVSQRFPFLASFGPVHQPREILARAVKVRDRSAADRDPELVEDFSRTLPKHLGRAIERHDISRSPWFAGSRTARRRAARPRRASTMRHAATGFLPFPPRRRASATASLPPRVPRRADRRRATPR